MTTRMIFIVLAPSPRHAETQKIAAAGAPPTPPAAPCTPLHPPKTAHRSRPRRGRYPLSCPPFCPVAGLCACLSPQTGRPTRGMLRIILSFSAQFAHFSAHRARVGAHSWLACVLGGGGGGATSMRRRLSPWLRGSGRAAGVWGPTKNRGGRAQPLDLWLTIARDY
jgi:hypothetical protein